MNYEQILSRPQSRANADAIVKFVGEDPQRLKDLSKLVFSKDRVLQQRAVWPFSDLLVEHPELVRPYYSKLLQILNDQHLHEAVARNVLRVFQTVDLPEKFQAKLLDICLANMRSEKLTIAVRAFSITVATRLCLPFPELRAELQMILTEIASHPMGPAIQVRVKRAVKDLQKVAA